MGAPIIALVRDSYSSELLVTRSGDLSRSLLMRILTKHQGESQETHYTGVRMFAETISREEFMLAARLVMEVLEDDGDSIGADRKARGNARPRAGAQARGGAALCAACGSLLVTREAPRAGAADHPRTPLEGAALSRQLRAEASQVTSRAAARRVWADEVRGSVADMRRLGAIARAKAEMKIAHRFLAYSREAARLEHALAVAHRELDLLRKGGAR